MGEDLRPMPYHLVPEVWTRMRPPEMSSKKASHQELILLNEASVKYRQGVAWDFTQIGPSAPQSDEAAVIELLHGGTRLHISCGAKFGCDYLIYDGPRNERHAFAGLRILRSKPTENHLPLPSAYNLAGYVRCLNTAGKLALLATVVQEGDTSGGIKHRVAIVDLALEKIAVTTSRRPKKTMEKRYQNLSKT